MDRDAVARAGRRSEAEEALAFERDREAALREQLAALVLDDERDRIDSEALALLETDDVRRVREALGALDEERDEADEDDPFAAEMYVSFEDDDEPEQDEAERLEGEIEESRRTQAALERFVAALDRPPVPEAG